MPSLYDELKALIYHRNNKERECRAYLHHAIEILFEIPGEAVVCDAEYRGHRGDSDYIVSGRGFESGNFSNQVFIWELKAPQCFVFQADPNSSNRLIPSIDLINAENQLLNYYDELKYSSDFHADFEITHPSNVRIGGIIIGCDRTIIRGEFSETEKIRLYNKALRCRNLLYRYENISLKLWNSILDHLKPPEEPPRQE